MQSDTALVPRGTGTMGSRSLQIGGSALYRASEAVLEKARTLAAHLLEANVDDIVLHDGGRVGVAGVPARALSWAELSLAASDRAKLPPNMEPGLAHALDFNQGEATYPFGAHVAVVEVDTETGRVELIRHVAVDDCGRILNPLLVRGQQHGGIAQGVAQALYEGVVYDDDGNPLTGNLMDYAMPSAAEFPTFEAVNTETPTPLNPLGAKGIGESGTIGSTPAVQNAVVDAVSHLGVRHIDMPLSAMRVWQAITAGGSMSTTFASPTLRLTDDQYRIVVGHCYDGLPDEACGLLAGPMIGGRAHRCDQRGLPVPQRRCIGPHLHRRRPRLPARDPRRREPGPRDRRGLALAHPHRRVSVVDRRAPGGRSGVVVRAGLPARRCPGPARRTGSSETRPWREVPVALVGVIADRAVASRMHDAAHRHPGRS